MSVMPSAECHGYTGGPTDDQRQRGKRPVTGHQEVSGTRALTGVLLLHQNRGAEPVAAGTQECAGRGKGIALSVPAAGRTGSVAMSVVVSGRFFLDRGPVFAAAFKEFDAPGQYREENHDDGDDINVSGDDLECPRQEPSTNDQQILLDSQCTHTVIVGRRHPFCRNTGFTTLIPAPGSTNGMVS